MSLSAFQSLLSRMFTWTWETSLAATVLIALVVLTQLLWGRFLSARWRYALWLLVAARLLMPMVPASSLSAFNLRNAVTAPRSTDRLIAPLGSSSASGRTLESARTLAGMKQGAAPAVAPGGPPPPSRLVPHWMRIAQGIWLMGAAGWFLIVLAAHRRMASWAKHQTPCTVGRIVSLVEEGQAALDLSRKVEVVETIGLSTPAILGFVRPRLLLPKCLLREMDDQELRLVILHELVHVKRRDVLLNWLLILLQSLHWFNPAVWLALKRLRAERELVCDAEVLSLLSAGEWRVYGNTLIKLAQHVSQSPLAPSLVPILQHQHEIERRITMISKFKPTPRLAVAASLALLLALCCLTFTRAAEKAAPPPAAEAAPKASAAERWTRGIKKLEEEWKKQDEIVKQKQSEVDSLRRELGVSELEAAGVAKEQIEPDVLRRLEVAGMEAHADYERMRTLYTHLTTLNRSALKRVVSTAAPDAQLTSLFEQMAMAEQKLAALSEGNASDHPEVKATHRVLEQISKQIDERLDGILEGLKIKMDAENARGEALQRQLEAYKKFDMESALKRRPYQQAKRDLETLQMVRERLALRIIQEKVDAAITKE